MSETVIIKCSNCKKEANFILSNVSQDEALDRLENALKIFGWAWSITGKDYYCPDCDK